MKIDRRSAIELLAVASVGMIAGAVLRYHNELAEFLERWKPKYRVIITDWIEARIGGFSRGVRLPVRLEPEWMQVLGALIYQQAPHVIAGTLKASVTLASGGIGQVLMASDAAGRNYYAVEILNKAANWVVSAVRVKDGRKTTLPKTSSSTVSRSAPTDLTVVFDTTSISAWLNGIHAGTWTVSLSPGLVGLVAGEKDGFKIHTLDLDLRPENKEPWWKFLIPDSIVSG